MSKHHYSTLPELLLDLVPFRVIFWVDEHLNHLRRDGNYKKCTWTWFCDYTDDRAIYGVTPRPRHISAMEWRKGGMPLWVKRKHEDE